MIYQGNDWGEARGAGSGRQGRLGRCRDVPDTCSKNCPAGLWLPPAVQTAE